jgi:hypothetical protein
MAAALLFIQEQDLSESLGALHKGDTGGSEYPRRINSTDGPDLRHD